MRSTCLRVSKRPNFQQLWRLCFAECTRCAVPFLSLSLSVSLSLSIPPCEIFFQVHYIQWNIKRLTLLEPTRIPTSSIWRSFEARDYPCLILLEKWSQRIHSRLRFSNFLFDIFHSRFETISNRASLSNNLVTASGVISVIESCKWTFLFSLRQSRLKLCGGILGR